MKRGNKFYFTSFFIFILIFTDFVFAEEKISASPLINIDQIKPSFDELDEDSKSGDFNLKIKEKKNFLDLKSSQAILIDWIKSQLNRQN